MLNLRKTITRNFPTTIFNFENRNTWIDEPCDMMSERKVIVVTGTPGTGKSAFAKKLSEKLDLRLIDLNRLIEREGIYELASDGTKEVAPEDLREVFTDIIEQSEQDLIVDGLLSHFLPQENVTEAVVLRAHPNELEKRLKGRGYSGEKLRDNLDSEALGVVLREAVQELGEEKVYEIDTTDIGVSEALERFKKAMEGKISLAPGSIDWLDDYLDRE